MPTRRKARPARTHHPVVDDEMTDPLTGQQWCMCGLPVDNVRHDLPRRTDEERAAEARRVGDSDVEA